MVAALGAARSRLFGKVQGRVARRQHALPEPVGPPPPDAPPGPPDEPELSELLSESQEEAVGIALSLERCGGSAGDVVRENHERLGEKDGDEARGGGPENGVSDDRRESGLSESQEEAAAISLSLECGGGGRNSEPNDGREPWLSESQEEAVGIALSLERCGGSMGDVAAENEQRLRQLKCVSSSPKRAQGACSGSDVPTPKTARTTRVTAQAASAARGTSAMLVLDDDDGAFVELAIGERAEEWHAAVAANRARALRKASEQQLILDQANGRGSASDVAGPSEGRCGDACVGGAGGSGDACADVAHSSATQRERIRAYVNSQSFATSRCEAHGNKGCATCLYNALANSSDEEQEEKGKEASRSRPSTARSIEGSGRGVGDGGSVGGGAGGNGADVRACCHVNDGSDEGRSGSGSCASRGKDVVSGGGNGAGVGVRSHGAGSDVGSHRDGRGSGVGGGPGGGDSSCSSSSIGGRPTNQLVQSTITRDYAHGLRVSGSFHSGGGAAAGAAGTSGSGGTASGAQAGLGELAEAAVAAAIKYMREQAGPDAPNAEQERVIRDFFEVGPPKEMLVIGPPGTGKSTVFQACARGVIAMDGVPVMIAEYNPQVHALNKGLSELARGSKKWVCSILITLIGERVSKRGVTVWGMVAAVGEAKVLERGWVDPPPPPTRER